MSPGCRRPTGLELAVRGKPRGRIDSGCTTATLMVCQQSGPVSGLPPAGRPRIQLSGVVLPEPGSKRALAKGSRRQIYLQFFRNLHSPTGRHHLAIVSALVLAGLLLLVVPVSRSRASGQPPIPSPDAIVADGLAKALRVQAEAVTMTLVEGGILPLEEGQQALSPWEEIPASALVPRALLVDAGRMLARGALASPTAQAGLFVHLENPVTFTLHEEGFVSSYVTREPTVGRALEEAGVELIPQDTVQPSVSSPLTAGLHIYVDHATRVELTLGPEEPRTVYTHAAKVSDLLQEQGITLGELDLISVDPAEPVREGMAVVITLVREEIETTDTPIPYETVYREDPELLQGEYLLIQPGSDGYYRREYRVRYENDQEVSRELIRETVVPPTTEIIARGTKAPVYVMPSPDGDLECARVMSVYATWYTAASAGGGGITATGVPVTKGIVAVDPRVIPLGTRMYIPGYGYGVAADTGGGIIGNMIDLGYGPDDVYDWSTRWVDICILP